EELEINLFKNHLFFSSQITSDNIFSDIVKSKDSRIRKLKSYLLKLSNNPPFWNDTQIHDCNNSVYFYNLENICNSSLAESSQRDKVILSFTHNKFLNEKIEIKKDEDIINLFNLINCNHFLDYLYLIDKISPLNFCLNRYKKTNLDFTQLEEAYGFDILNAEQIQAYLNSFMKFSLMKWKDIDSDGGFQYKPYNGDIFKNTKYSAEKIKKFRISQLYRCFGFRNDNIFYVLRFEIDHKISDKG
ncbi:MAG: hypothetical protein U9P72_00690, partial [Campylobacterota bacterium]|nr:hypothetical protein [Campylobacterota bacterium]